MSAANKIVKTLNSVSDQLHDLTLEAVFSKKLLDEERVNSISLIKRKICLASDDLDKLYVYDKELTETLDKIVAECVSSLHEIHKNMKSDLIKQNAEDDYAELSAQIHYLQNQVERIKNN